MKKGALFGVLILILILNVSFVLAQENETEDTTVSEKAYECLDEKVKDKCSSLTLEERIFSLLAIGECKDEIISDSEYKSDIKLTAQAILALDKVNVDTNEAKEWLLSQNTTPANMEWLLQIESTEETTCSITYSGSSYNIIIGEDRKINSPAGACLSLYSDRYWLKISKNCYDYEFEISCDKSFLTTLLYKETASDIIYVSADTNTASAGGTTTEKVNSFCFAQGISCEYEASLWAALVLDYVGEDVSAYLSYLVSMADEIENKKYLPESFLYSLTNNFRNDLLIKQLPEGSWKVADNKFYDTALALLPFQNEELTEKTDAINWLEEMQGEDGCWDGGNIVNTAFILYSVWPKGLSGINGEDEGVDCEDAGYHCMSRMSCQDAGGDVLEDYTGCFGTHICCTKKETLKTCSEQGGEVCDSDEECSISTIEASDTSECCLGYCREPTPEKSDCELYVDGECRTSCYSDEEKVEEYDCPSGKVCCIEKTISEEKQSSLWIWILLGLIILVVIGIIFKDKLRAYWLKIKSKFGKSKPGPKRRFRPGFRPAPPGRPVRRVMPRRILPPSQQRRPVRKPAPKKPKGELEDVFKKLRDMGK